MATCEVCGEGFGEDAERHSCSLSRDNACQHACHKECLQTYRLKHSCPEDECPFCAQQGASSFAAGTGSGEEEPCDEELQKMEDAADEAQANAAGAGASPASPDRSQKPPALVSSPPAAQGSPPMLTQTSPDSPPLTQGGGEAPRLSIPSFGIDIYDLSRTRKQLIAVEDPVCNILRHYLECKDDGQSLLLLHTKSAYQGLGTEDSCYQTVRAWLSAALADPSDHHRLANDFAFSTRDMLPVPFEASLRTICRKEGWEPETLMAPFLSNIGWMEHPSTRLRLPPDEEHRRGCIVQIVCAGDPSMRKSSLKEFTSKTLLSHADVPPVIRAGDATSTDATIKGIRASLKEHGRGGIISDEIATTYAVTSGRDARNCGLHYGNKEKMCTWLNCEDDKNATGEGYTALSDYAFLHQVYGQVSLCEFVLQPTASMFSKRIHATWQMRPAACDPDQQTMTSKQFLIDFFGWMGREASNKTGDHHFDVFALSVLRKALQAIADFLSDYHEDVEEPIQQKLRYADTDVARYANAAMRCRQFAESKRMAALGQTVGDPGVEMTIFDLGHALHIWHRQMCLWFAFYRSKQVMALASPKLVPDPRSRDVPELDAKLKLQRAILSNPRCSGPTSTSTLRATLKYFFQKEKEKDPAKKILGAVRGLLKLGILKEVEKAEVDARRGTDHKGAVKRKISKPKDDGKNSQSQGGHVVLFYRKCTWEELQPNSEAQEFIAKLQLSSNHFD